MAWIPLAAAAVSAAGSIGGGYLAGRSSQPQETKLEKTKRKLIDQMIGSLYGQGPFSDLYKFDEDTFQKSYVEPAKARFKNQIAPSIQQQYIASGQHRGSGLEDQLLRAGVDLDQMLNEAMATQKDQAQNRKINAMNQIIGAGSGAAAPYSGNQIAGQATSGYLSSEGFQNTVKDLAKEYGPGQPVSTNSNVATPAVTGAQAATNIGVSGGMNPYATKKRKGYESDYDSINPWQAAMNQRGVA